MAKKLITLELELTEELLTGLRASFEELCHYGTYGALDFDDFLHDEIDFRIVEHMKKNIAEELEFMAYHFTRD